MIYSRSWTWTILIVLLSKISWTSIGCITILLHIVDSIIWWSSIVIIFSNIAGLISLVFISETTIVYNVHVIQSSMIFSSVVILPHFSWISNSHHSIIIVVSRYLSIIISSSRSIILSVISVISRILPSIFDFFANDH